MKKALLLVLLLLLCPALFGQGIENSLQAQSVQAKITVRGNGSISGKLMNTKAKIEVLSFGDTTNQEVLSLEESLEINGKEIKPTAEIDSLGNRFAVFEVGETGNFSYRIEAVVKTDALFPRLEDFNLAEEITQYGDYLKATDNIESGHESVRTLAFNRFPGQSWLETVAQVTEWTNETIEYDLSFFPGIYPATQVLESRKGVCDEYSVVAAAILRAKGIPARMVNGIAFNSQEQEDGWRNHAWVEAFNPNVGWVPLDPTFGEAGTVDGTHFIRGYSPDPSQSSVSRTTALETVSVEVEEAQAEVEVLSFRNFEQVFSLEAADTVMPANRWHTVEVKARNNMDGTAISWLSLGMPEGFLVQDQRRILVFEEGEEKALEWQVRVEQDLGENQQLVGNYLAAAIGTELKKGLKILPGEKFGEKARLNVADLIPSMNKGTLTVEIFLENLGGQGAVARVSLDSYTQDFEVGAFESRTVKIEVENAQDQEYLVLVEGPGLSFEKRVVVQSGIPIVEEQLPKTQTREKSFLEPVSETLFTLEAGVATAAIIAGIAIAVLLKKLLGH